MDWLLLIGLLTFAIIAGVIAYTGYTFVRKTKKDFHAHRPALRVTNLSALNADRILTLTPEFENVGCGVAYDCVLQMRGWEGNFSVKSIHPQGPRYHKHVVPIRLAPDAPIRTASISKIYLRLSYRDRWGLAYECWYPVEQIQRTGFPLCDIQIDLTHPELTEPTPSFWTMRRLLRATPSDG